MDSGSLTCVSQRAESDHTSRRRFLPRGKLTLVRSVLLLAVVVSSLGCVSLHEVAGDILLKRGDEQGALTEYKQLALEKARSSIGIRAAPRQASPIVTSELDRASRIDAASAVRALVKIRKEARAERATQALMTRLDAA